MAENYRKSGILLHITSLPNQEAVGTLGRESHNFLDDLLKNGQSIWQMLPIHPTQLGDSPFQGPSAFAGNPNLISLDMLLGLGDLSWDDHFDYLKNWHDYRVRYKLNGEMNSAFLWHNKLGFEGNSDAALRRAHQGFLKHASPTRKAAYEAFVGSNSSWLEAYALFMALKEHYGFGVTWDRWDKKHRLRLQGFDEGLEAAADFYKYVQFVFDEQMKLLHDKAHAKGIELIGDIPIYPAYDSADVWANKDLFQLDRKGRMKFVAGVPPDYFSEDGQKWGNPLYNWGNDKVFGWWAARLRREFRYFDTVKIDHFRAFYDYCAIPADDPDARRGEWKLGPSKKLFDYLKQQFPSGLSLIAEDLGDLNDGVRELLAYTGLPGMRVLVFADFNDPGHIYLPQNAPPNSVVYTGTHDNATLLERFCQLYNENGGDLWPLIAPDTEPCSTWEITTSDSKELSLTVGPHYKFLDMALNSPARRVIMPIQDVLGLDSRMNNPAKVQGQWTWRLSASQLESFGNGSGEILRILTITSGRYH